MPRKKKPAAHTTADATEQLSGAEASAAATAEAPAAEAVEPRATSHAAEHVETGSPQVDADGRQEPPKNWGDPYKSIFSCPEQGFELGEDRRFKQRVFRFAERPSDEVRAELKDGGFTYRATERSWTVPADADSRKMTDEMARRWAGPNYIQGIDR